MSNLTAVLVSENTLQPEKLTYTNFAFGIEFLKKIAFSCISIFLELMFRKLHYTYSFVLPRITWKMVLELLSW